MSLKNSEANGEELPEEKRTKISEMKNLLGTLPEELPEEKRAKISEMKNLLGTVPEELSLYCSDASVARYLTARNWSVKKATKMLKETLKWRLEYKPEKIRWEEVAHEAETGKIYRSNCFDKYGRSILVMRPSCQNTKSSKGQIRYLVYCMENAILNLPSDQEQMVWLIDFHGYNLSHLSVKITKETADVLQNHYPERLGIAILYNPPKFFEPFWRLVKPFLEPKTSRKVKFVYSDNQASMKIMEEFFNINELEQTFGGKNGGFEFKEYATRMREDDRKMPVYWSRVNNEASSSVIHDSLMDFHTENEEKSASFKHLLQAEQHPPESS